MKALAFEFLAAVGGLGTFYSAQYGRPLTVILAGGFTTLAFALLAVSASIQGRPEPACNRLGTARESQAHATTEIRHTLETAQEEVR